MGDGEIMRADLVGTNPLSLAVGQEFPLAITTDADNVYWTTLDGAVRTVEKGGSSTITNVNPTMGPPCNDVAVDNTHIYYTKGSSLLKVPIGGTVSSVIASGLIGVQRIRVDGPDLYVTTSEDSNGRVLKIAK
jgi:hypothetical protein